MNFFSKVFSWFRGFFAEVAATSIGKMTESLREIALAVCDELTLSSLSSEEKRAEAYNRIWAKAIQEGREISTTAINLAIEMAVAMVKNQANPK